MDHLPELLGEIERLRAVAWCGYAAGAGVVVATKCLTGCIVFGVDGGHSSGHVGGSGLWLIRNPDQVRGFDSASDFARVSPDGGADETAEGKIGGLAKDQACADEGPGGAGQDTEAAEEDREEAESGGRDQDSPVPKAAGEGYRTRTQAKGAGTTRRQAPRRDCPERGTGAGAWGAWSDAGSRRRRHVAVLCGAALMGVWAFVARLRWCSWHPE